MRVNLALSELCVSLVKRPSDERVERTAGANSLIRSAILLQTAVLGGLVLVGHVGKKY